MFSDFENSVQSPKRLSPLNIIYELLGRMFVVATVFKLGLCDSDMWLNWFLSMTVSKHVCVCVCVCACFSSINLSCDSSCDKQLSLNVLIHEHLQTNIYTHRHHISFFLCCG